MEEKKQVEGKRKSMMVANLPQQNRKRPPLPKTHQLLKMSQPRQSNGMEEKNDPLEQGEEVQVEGPKKEMPPQQCQGLPPGRTEIAPLREEATLPIITESLPKVAEQVVDGEASTLGEAVVTVAPIQPLLGPAVEVEAEWGAGVAETSARLLLGATTMRPRVRAAVAGTDRIELTITRPGPGTEVKPAVRVQSMRKSPRGGGKEVQRLAARVVQATLVSRTRRRTRNLTPRMALNMATPPAVGKCHLHHPEVLRLVFSPPEACPLVEEGAEVVEEETSTGVVATLEARLEETGSDPAQALTLDPPSHQPLAESNKVHHKARVIKIWAGVEMEERRKTR